MSKRINTDSSDSENETNKKAKLYIEAIEKAEREDFSEVVEIKSDGNSDNETDIKIIDVEKKKGKTEKEKMLDGELYNYNDPQLLKERIECRRILKKINELDPGEMDKRMEYFGKLFKKVGKDALIDPPFHCDYGTNISLGDRSFFHFNSTVLDCNKVTIGNDSLFGPGCKIIAVTDSLLNRRHGREFSKPVKVGNGCFIGAGVIILPGVTIGDNVVVGAGSVVATDVESNTVVSGNPAKVIGKTDNTESTDNTNSNDPTDN